MNKDKLLKLITDHNLTDKQIGTYIHCSPLTVAAWRRGERNMPDMAVMALYAQLYLVGKIELNELIKVMK